MHTASMPRILICEDEFLIASDLARGLAELGARVVGFAINASKALELALSEHLEIDAAVLDINLAGEPVYDAATALKKRGVTVIFYSGYSRRELPADFHSDQFLSKPAQPSDIMRAIAAASGHPGAA